MIANSERLMTEMSCFLKDKNCFQLSFPDRKKAKKLLEYLIKKNIYYPPYSNYCPNISYSKLNNNSFISQFQPRPTIIGGIKIRNHYEEENIVIEGWNYDLKKGVNDFNRKVALVNKKNAYIFNTYTYSRPDIVISSKKHPHTQKKNCLFYSGMLTEINKKEIEKGIYDIIIIYSNDSDSYYKKDSQKITIN